MSNAVFVLRAGASKGMVEDALRRLPWPKIIALLLKREVGFCCFRKDALLGEILQKPNDI